MCLVIYFVVDSNLTPSDKNRVISLGFFFAIIWDMKCVEKIRPLKSGPPVITPIYWDIADGSSLSHPYNNLCCRYHGYNQEKLPGAVFG